MYNKAILIGRVATDLELKTTPTGASVCTFRVAVNRNYTKNGERKADFINVVTWRNTAEFVSKFFSKGKAIGVEGTMQTRDYTDKDGNKRSVFEVVADNCFFVADKKAADVEVDAPIDDSEDIPF